MQPSIDTYRLIAEQAVDPIFVNDHKGCVLYANPAAEKTFGYGRQEMLGQCLHDMIHHHHPDGRPFPREECTLYRSYTSGKIIDDYVETFIRKDGSLITMGCTSAPVDIGATEPGQVFFAHDLTQRIDNEIAMAKSEQRFRLIADSMPQLVWMLAPDGSITYINERFRQYIYRDVDSGVECITPIHPDDVQHTKDALDEALRTGNDYRVEHRARGADGSYRWFLSHGVPLRDDKDKVIAWYGSSTDIDDIRRAGDALRRSQETLRLAVETTNLGLWEYYTETGELVWDEINRRNYGVPVDGPVDVSMFIQRIHPEDRERVAKVVGKLAQPGGTGKFHTEYRVIRLDDGALRWLRVNGQSVLDTEGHSRFVGTTLDITDSKLAEQRIRDASQRDALTGLPNRALLFEYCDHLIAVAQRTRRNGALLFIDLDRFKPINDTHGHDVGDQVLKLVAKRLLACTRHEDIVGRLGGDEFVVALPHPDDMHGPSVVAQHIVDKISEPYYVGKLQLHLSPSIGISLYPRHGDTFDALIKCADTAMYEAKKAGRKRFRFYTPSLEKGMDYQCMLETRLREALDHNGMLLHYQPVMDIESGATVGVEALLRLPMPDGIALAPHEFLPAAEAAGLINRLGEWVAQEVCRQHRQWRDAGLPAMSMAINIAAQQFRQRSFPACLAENMRRSDMDPACMQIELTESTVLEDVTDTIAALEEIRALGVRVALDDFGIGHASVGLLSSLPLDKLKIDQSFVSRIGSDAKSQTIADTVLALGRSLNLEVVGEGIESEEALDYLRDHGCNQAQGYYVSRPLSADDFEHWFRNSVVQVQAQPVH